MLILFLWISVWVLLLAAFYVNKFPLTLLFLCSCSLALKGLRKGSWQFLRLSSVPARDPDKIPPSGKKNQFLKMWIFHPYCLRKKRNPFPFHSRRSRRLPGRIKNLHKWALKSPLNRRKMAYLSQTWFLLHMRYWMPGKFWLKVLHSSCTLFLYMVAGKLYLQFSWCDFQMVNSREVDLGSRTLLTCYNSFAVNAQKFTWPWKVTKLRTV